MLEGSSRPSPVAGRPPVLADLFPAARDAGGPVEVRVGTDFDVAALPEAEARRVIALLAHREPYPIGAVLAHEEGWLFLLPPGSAAGLSWPAPFGYLDRGVLRVPPVPSAGPVFNDAGPLRWIRFGTPERRAFTAPLVLYAVAPLLVRETARVGAVACGARPARFSLSGRGVCHV
ncbi:hypothetical protein AB0F20_09900 [Streptomyces goshikiensis]|uniref:hypothetical protein n=1 Tax=Streptomyces goshikiensis TaxID=1942 RepID=UPI0033DAB4E1